MKKSFLTLNLLTASNLIAQDLPQKDSSYNQTECNNTWENSCTSSFKSCIDYECYTPAYYNLQNDCGLFVTSEFLYWYAQETNLPFAVVVETILAFPPSSATPEPRRATVIKEFEYVDDEWCPGFRVGLGWNYSCDGWDFYANYTYYHNSSSGSAAFPDILAPLPDAGGKSLLNPWVQTALSGFLYNDHMSANWKFTLNSVDVEIGRKYWLSRCFNLRPFSGIRASWTDTKFRVKASLGPTDSVSNPTVSDVTENNLNTFKSRFWGVGIFGGLQPTWHFFHCFSLYANMDFALLWGRFNGKKDEEYFGTVVVSNNLLTNSDASNTYKDNYSRMQAILDLGIGLRYETTWCCNRYRTALNIGWEHHTWFDSYKYSYDQLDFAITTAEGVPIIFFDSLGNLNTDLGFGGLVIRASLDF